MSADDTQKGDAKSVDEKARKQEEVDAACEAMLAKLGRVVSRRIRDLVGGRTEDVDAMVEDWKARNIRLIALPGIQSSATARGFERLLSSLWNAATQEVEQRLNDRIAGADRRCGVAEAERDGLRAELETERVNHLASQAKAQLDKDHLGRTIEGLRTERDASKMALATQQAANDQLVIDAKAAEKRAEAADERARAAEDRARAAEQRASAAEVREGKELRGQIDRVLQLLKPALKS